MDFNDKIITERIRALETAIETWAVANALWYDCGFQTYAHRIDGEPSDPPIATIIYFGSDFGRMLDGDFSQLDREFDKILNDHGFWYERWDGVSAYLYPNEESPFYVPISDYVRWQWICGLLQPDVADVYEEIYSHFARRPDDLHRLDWREFEILLFRTFQQQGFQAELGPGRGDGGVDIRLFQRDPIGDILTLVQVKRYAARRKIGLQAVQALHGAAEVEKAQRSLFITTSAYQPAAQRFAERTSGRLTLATSGDVIQWCRDSSEGVITDKSKLVEPAQVRKLIGALVGRRDPRVLHANTGVTMILNSYALVLKETRHAALLMGLQSHQVTSDSHGLMGMEVPTLDPSRPPHLTAETVRRAKRTVENGRVSYWDGQHLYTPWNGEAQHFSYLD